jgi:hypothetical protein
MYSTDHSPAAAIAAHDLQPLTWGWSILSTAEITRSPRGRGQDLVFARARQHLRSVRLLAGMLNPMKLSERCGLAARGRPRFDIARARETPICPPETESHQSVRRKSGSLVANPDNNRSEALAEDAAFHNAVKPVGMFLSEMAPPARPGRSEVVPFRDGSRHGCFRSRAETSQAGQDTCYPY